MKLFYFRSFVLILFLFCFSANVFSATSTFIKAKIHQATKAASQEGFDENKDVKEELFTDGLPFFSHQYLIDVHPNDLKVATFRFHLPIPFQKLLEKPPKR
ncbi:MAG: hypothetical protein EOP00_13600 [Pedobacter sp.]|nr:MAG: hypothetical protein EOP00_13600 [Pedobacter sp.]